MSMRIQDACTNCCATVQEYASNAADWIGKTVTATGAFFTEGAKKVADFVKPYFENVSTFARDNENSPFIFAAIGCTIGAILTAIITNVFCRSTDPSTPPTTPATQQ